MCRTLLLFFCNTFLKILLHSNNLAGHPSKTSQQVPALGSRRRRMAPSVKASICDLEMQALRNRAEAFDAGLTHINSTNELKKTMIKSLPKVSVFWKYTRDQNKYLYRKDWKDIGAHVYFDLMKWFENRSETKAARAEAAAAHAKMGVVALGIASQVRVAALDYSDAMAKLKSAEASLESTEQVWRAMKQKTPQDEPDKIALDEARATILQGILDRNEALGEVNATLAELQGAMGTNYIEIAAARPNISQ